MNKKTVKDILQERAHLPEHFCIVPFTNVIIEPDGGVGICRLHGHKFAIGNLKNQSLFEIWNGEKAQSWRREFLSDNIVTCKTLMDDRRCHLTAAIYDLLPDTEIKAFQSYPILKLTANFNGHCNLRCQMCSVWKAPNGFYTEDNFWKSARKEIFPHLKAIDMLSGEPFLQADTYKLIDEVLPLSPDCQWNFTTNMHWDFDEHARSYLKKILIKAINVSIDSLIPEVFFKIREPGNLQYVLDNVEELIKFRDSGVCRQPFELSVNIGIQKDNWKEASAFINYCLARKIYPYIYIVREPVEFSILSFELEKRVEILDFYLEHVAPTSLKYLHRIFYPLIHSLEKIEQAIYFTRLEEKMRNRNTVS